MMAGCALAVCLANHWLWCLCMRRLISSRRSDHVDAAAADAGDAAAADAADGGAADGGAADAVDAAGGVVADIAELNLAGCFHCMLINLCFLALALASASLSLIHI